MLCPGLGLNLLTQIALQTPRTNHHQTSTWKILSNPAQDFNLQGEIVFRFQQSYGNQHGSMIGKEACERRRQVHSRFVIHKSVRINETRAFCLNPKLAKERDDLWIHAAQSIEAAKRKTR